MTAPRHDLLQVRIDAEQVHGVVEHADEQRAEERADDAAAAAHQAGAADDDGGDRLEQFVAGARSAASPTKRAPCRESRRSPRRRR